MSFDGIAKACATAMGAPEPEIIHFNPKDFDFGKKKSFPMRDQHFFASIDKAKRELDWAPRFGLVDGLADSYQKVRSRLLRWSCCAVTLAGLVVSYPSIGAFPCAARVLLRWPCCAVTQTALFCCPRGQPCCHPNVRSLAPVVPRCHPGSTARWSRCQLPTGAFPCAACVLLCCHPRWPRCQLPIGTFPCAACVLLRWPSRAVDYNERI